MNMNKWGKITWMFRRQRIRASTAVRSLPSIAASSAAERPSKLGGGIGGGVVNGRKGKGGKGNGGLAAAPAAAAAGTLAGVAAAAAAAPWGCCLGAVAGAG